MTKKKLNFAVIGIGGIGLHHARTIKNQADAQLIGFLDSNADVIARAHAEFPEASVCDTIDCLLSLPELDAVVIATPNVLHAQFSIAAAKHKKHVLCEKPLAMTAVEAKKMVEAIEKAGVVGMTNFSYRWVPSFRLARNLVREGEFGKITRLHIKYLQSWLKDENAAITWRNQKELAGFGALGDLGSHMIDAACFITGATPERVVGVHHIHVPEKIDPKSGKKTPVTTDTDSQFMVDFGSFVGIFETSQVEPAHGNHLVVSFGGEKGTCRVYSEDGGNIEVAVGTPYASHPTWATHVPKIPIPTSISSSPGVIPDFIAAIRGELKDYPSFRDGATVQGVLGAIFKSAQSNKWEKA